MHRSEFVRCCIRCVLVVSLCALLPHSAFCAQQENADRKSPLNGKEVFSITDSGWSTLSHSSDCLTGAGDDSWQLTLSQAQNLTVTAEDENCPGDYYEVRVDGSLIGVTPRPAAWGCSFFGDPVSSGSFMVTLCPGTHLITVRDAGFDGHSQGEINEESMCPSEFQLTGTLSPVLAAGDACALLKIVKPDSRANFPFDNPELTSTQVTLQAQSPGTKVDWSLILDYKTSHGYGNYHLQLPSFETQAGTSTSQQFLAKGGRVTIQASSVVGSQTVMADPVVITVTGAQIPDDWITTRLVGLYASGATPRLMTGIAEVESTYQQFEVRTLYKYNGYWPTESHQDGGSHIGLMMVDTSLALKNAWSWRENTAEGVSEFVNDKLAAAGRVINKIIKSHPGLRKLSGAELENVALVFYGPYGAKGPYYAPAPTGSGWVWVKNPANPNGVAYADSVRSMVQ